MRPRLIGYFDVGESYGLTDTVFASNLLAPDLDISLVGWTNPLGRGILVNVLLSHPEIINLWRDAAKAQISRLDFETGWTTASGISEEDFDKVLADAVLRHDVTLCEMRIYAVGAVLIQMELGTGLPDELVRGVLACFEFAAYTPPISNALYVLGRERANAATGIGDTLLTLLSQRKPPEVRRDA